MPFRPSAKGDALIVALRTGKRGETRIPRLAAADSLGTIPRGPLAGAGLRKARRQSCARRPELHLLLGEEAYPGRIRSLAFW